MAVKLRLRRMGRKQRPVYALVAADARAPRDGRFIEDLGRYEPVREPATFSVNVERVLYWLGQGAQPSDTVRNLLSNEGVMLELHLRRKGKGEDEIAAELEKFRAHRAEKNGGASKMTTAERKAAALEAERKAAAEAARARAEETRKAEEAKRQAAEQIKQAEEAASTEEEQATVEASADDVPETAPEAATEQPVVEASHGEPIEAAEAQAASDDAEQAQEDAAEEPKS